MKTFYSDLHRGHHGAKEFHLGEMVPIHEMPSRMDMVLECLHASDLGPIVEPESFDDGPILAVHEADYVAFLAEAWELWTAEGGGAFALPFTFAGRGMRARAPRSVHGKLGHYAFDLAVPFVAGTWPAVRAAVDVALSGQKEVAGGARAAFSLCRPPGHHAMAGQGGGYCYLNNAAIAAQAFRDQGAARVAVLDVDYHHGNGTQRIFYQRPDVLFVSLHGDPEEEYPYYLGYADETGAGAGEGCNVNFPLPWGIDWGAYGAALEAAQGRIHAYSPDALVVSLGVDTFKDDPISHFKLETEDYPRIGRMIAGLDLPTHFVMEGGYAVEEIGINTLGVLAGFMQAA